MSEPQIEFRNGRIAISRYPFQPGSCRKSISISATEIKEVDVKQCALLVGNELIYPPGWPTEELSKFSAENGVELKDRYDIWADILEPFVDTSFSRAEVIARNSRLRAANFSTWRVMRLRLLYSLPLIVFQGIAGEWVGLHHYHLLYALRFLRLFGIYGVAYRHTMKIALEPYRAA